MDRRDVVFRRFQDKLSGNDNDGSRPRGDLGPDEYAVSGYAHDCVIGGHIRLVNERLSDMLNEDLTLVLQDVVVVALADGHIVELPELEVGRDELVAVSLVGPRGNEGRRRTTREVPLAITMGPYRIWGYIHPLPTTDPMAMLMGHRPMVPLTNAAVVYDRGGVVEVERMAGLILNRDYVGDVNQTIRHEDPVAIGLDREYGIAVEAPLQPRDPGDLSR